MDLDGCQFCIQRWECDKSDKELSEICILLKNKTEALLSKENNTNKGKEK